MVAGQTWQEQHLQDKGRTMADLKYKDKGVKLPTSAPFQGPNMWFFGKEYKALEGVAKGLDHVSEVTSTIAVKQNEIEDANSIASASTDLQMEYADGLKAIRESGATGEEYVAAERKLLADVVGKHSPQLRSKQAGKAWNLFTEKLEAATYVDALKMGTQLRNKQLAVDATDIADRMAQVAATMGSIDMAHDQLDKLSLYLDDQVSAGVMAPEEADKILDTHSRAVEWTYAKKVLRQNPERFLELTEDEGKFFETYPNLSPNDLDSLRDGAEGLKRRLREEEKEARREALTDNLDSLFQHITDGRIDDALTYLKSDSFHDLAFTTRMSIWENLKKTGGKIVTDQALMAGFTKRLYMGEDVPKEEILEHLESGLRVEDVNKLEAIREKQAKKKGQFNYYSKIIQNMESAIKDGDMSAQDAERAIQTINLAMEQSKIDAYDPRLIKVKDEVVKPIVEEDAFMWIDKNLSQEPYLAWTDGKFDPAKTGYYYSPALAGMGATPEETYNTFEYLKGRGLPATPENLQAALTILRGK